jgi:hypothetical protein
MTTKPQEVIVKLSFIRPNKNNINQQNQHLNYLTYRPDPDGTIPQDRGRSRWIDRGLGHTGATIAASLNHFKSPHVYAWNLIISPNPKALADLKHPTMRENFMRHLVEHSLEDWFEAQGKPRPLYAYVYHDKDNELTGLKQPHAHIVMAGTYDDLYQNVPYRLYPKEIALLQNAINQNIEAVRSRFQLRPLEQTQAVEHEHNLEIPFQHLNRRERKNDP